MTLIHGMKRQCPVITLPAGDGERDVVLYRFYESNGPMDPIECFGFIDIYQACWSVKFGTVECGLEFSDDLHDEERFRLDLQQDLSKDDNFKDDPTTRFVVPSPPGVEVSIGPPSLTYCWLFNWPRPREDSPKDYVGMQTLVIKNIDVPTAGRAKEALETIGNSLFFGWTLQKFSHVPLLQRWPIGKSRPDWHRDSWGDDLLNEPDAPLKPPTRKFNATAMSLWWYARGAQTMPLLQFLASYQVVEHFFTIGW